MASTTGSEINFAQESGVSWYYKIRAYTYAAITETTDTEVTISIGMKTQFCNANYWTFDYSLSGTGIDSDSDTGMDGTVQSYSSGKWCDVIEDSKFHFTATVSRGTSAKTATYTYKTRHKSSDSRVINTSYSTATVSLTVPALDSYTVTCYDYDTDGNYLGEAGSKTYYYGKTAKGSDWGTTSPYTGYKYNSCSSTTVTSDDTVYRYFAPDTLTVYCYDTFSNLGDLGTQSKTISYSETFRGSDWGSSTERDVYYSGYTYVRDDGETSPYSYNWCARYFDKSVYSVTCTDYDDLGNQIGTQSAKSYIYGSTAKGSDWGTTAPSGYSYSSCSDTTVTSDTSVTRTFNRNSYTVYEYDVIDSTSGTVLGQNTGSFKYKEEVRGSDISTATYAGYHYIEDTSCEVSTTASNNKVYRIFNANEYMLEYDLGPGAEEEPLPRSATYNQWLKIPDPVRLGYELEGWNLSGMSYDTHYYSPDGSTKHSFTGSTASKIYGPYFMNLTSDENGTVYLEAVWKAKGLGRIYLESDKKYHSALCFIYHDGKYYQAIPYIYHDDKYRIGG